MAYEVGGRSRSSLEGRSHLVCLMFKGIPLAVGMKVAFGAGAGPPAAITVTLAVEGGAWTRAGASWSAK